MSQTQKPKVLVAILNQGWIRPEFTYVVGEMQKDERVDVTIYHASRQPSENNRNHTCKKALEEGYDWLLTIDHDTIPQRNPLDLIFMGKDIIGCAYPAWNTIDPNYPIYFVAMDRVEDGYKEHKNKVGLEEVDAVGSGCLLISRKVLEAVKEPFVRKWKDGFAITGLDFYFCEKAKEAGFKIYCHYDYVCDHIKEISLLDVLKFKHGR